MTGAGKVEQKMNLGVQYYRAPFPIPGGKAKDLLTGRPVRIAKNRVLEYKAGPWGIAVVAG